MFYNRHSTVVFPRELAEKFDLNLVMKLSAWMGKIGKIERKEWKKIECEGLAVKVKYFQEEIKDILCKKSSCLITQIDDTSIYICQWCKSQTYRLNAHHFPIAKKDGGKETVDICANCHSEFHWLVDHYHYKVKEEYEKIFLDCYKEFYDHCDSQEVINEQT